MFKKSAPVLLLGGVMLAVSCASMAQDKGGGTSIVPTVAGSGKVSVETLVTRYQSLAGSEANAKALVSGLRDGTKFTLVAVIETQEKIQVGVKEERVQTGTTTIRQPAPPPQNFILIQVPVYSIMRTPIYEMRTIRKEESTDIEPPTGNMGLGNVDIALALTQAIFTAKNVTTPSHPDLMSALVGSNGVLTMRAGKMGWGEVAKAMGFELK
jgi:hypothetical protein